MILKKVNPKTVMRMKLSKALRDMNLSIATCKKVVCQLKGMTDEQAEEKASQLLVLLDSCKSEAEVLEKLSV